MECTPFIVAAAIWAWRTYRGLKLRNDEIALLKRRASESHARQRAMFEQVSSTLDLAR